MRSVRIILWSFATVSAVIFATVLGYGGLSNSPATSSESASINDIGGPFRLASSNGTVVDSKDLVGKPYGVFFGFTHCPEVCPTTIYEMTKTLEAVGSDAKDFRLFFITVDPERDTAAVMKDYLANFDPRIVALVPTTEELAKVAKEFYAMYGKVPGSDGEYTMIHSALIYLMNGKGKLASTISYDDPPDNRVAKIRSLLADG
jgi:protein SCO1/2